MRQVREHHVDLRPARQELQRPRARRARPGPAGPGARSARRSPRAGPLRRRRRESRVGSFSTRRRCVGKSAVVGSTTSKRAPPSTVSPAMLPPISSTILRESARPSPVPLSGALVVTKGSNSRSAISAGRPPALSSTRTRRPCSVARAVTRTRGSPPPGQRRRGVRSEGVVGVDEEVHQHLLEQRLVAVGGRRTRVLDAHREPDFPRPGTARRRRRRRARSPRGARTASVAAPRRGARAGGSAR